MDCKDCAILQLGLSSKYIEQILADTKYTSLRLKISLCIAWGAYRDNLEHPSNILLIGNNSYMDTCLLKTCTVPHDESACMCTCVNVL